ncbi:MAG: hypothetical protein WCG13_06350 [Burkholderiales bacterium]
MFVEKAGQLDTVILSVEQCQEPTCARGECPMAQYDVFANPSNTRAGGKP